MITKMIPYSIDDFIVRTVIKQDVELKGELVFSTSLRIDGKFEGNIISEQGLLIISETSVVKGDIKCGTLMLAGKMYGNIEATKKIELFSKSILIGNMKAPRFRMEDQVDFEGECEILGQKEDKERR